MHVRSVKHQQTDWRSTNGHYCKSWELRWKPMRFLIFFQAWDLLWFPINMDICLKLEWVWLQKAMQAFNYHLFVSPDLSGLGPSLISNQPGIFSQIGMSLVAEGDKRVNILDFDNQKISNQPGHCLILDESGKGRRHASYFTRIYEWKKTLLNVL